MKDSIILQNLNTTDLTQLIKDGVKSQLENFKETLNTHNPDELLTRDQTCKFLQIDSSTLWAWTNKGVCSQIKMNFFAQNLREVSANLVKNFDTEIGRAHV